MWTALRQEIEKIRLEKQIPESDFRPLALSEWQVVEDNIYSTFCKLSTHQDKPGWLWSELKPENDEYSFQCMHNFPFNQLSRLVDHSEKVWLFLNETVSERNKFWFYEGYIKPIVDILYESGNVVEVYIASKKYEWLLCVNHHDYLIATGHGMPDKLRHLKKTE